jgi:hypothetical protein
MEIKLVEPAQLVRRTEVQQVSRAAVFGKIDHVFDEFVPWPSELPAEKERRFPG